MGEPKVTAEELLSSLVDLPLRDQVAILEEVVRDYDLITVADVLALCAMTVMLGVDESSPQDVRQRLGAVVATIRKFNESRLADEPPVK
jgi:hypothetical protein